MTVDWNVGAKRLGDRELIDSLRRCAAEDREVTARLLAHLAEVETRGLYRDQGYDSMFNYLVRALNMSESEAGLRLRAARFAQAHPLALELLACGELHLTALSLLSHAPANSLPQLLEQSRRRSKQQIQELIAKHSPKPDVPSTIRKLPDRSSQLKEPSAAVPVVVPRPVAALCPGATTMPLEPCSARRHVSSNTSSVVITSSSLQVDSPAATSNLSLAVPVGCSALQEPAGADNAEVAAFGCGGRLAAEWNPMPSEVQADAASRGNSSKLFSCSSGIQADGDGFRLRPLDQSEIVPLSEGRYKVAFTADHSLQLKLRQAQDLLRGQVRAGDLAAVFDKALTLLIAERRKQLFSRTKNPCKQPKSMVAITRAEPIPNVAVPRTPREPKATAPSNRPGANTTVVEAELDSSFAAGPAQPTASRAPTVQPRAGAAAGHASGDTVIGAVPNRRSRHIPNDVRREVADRDGERCAFVAPDGRRCESRARLEFDHHPVPFGRGGEHTPENLRLLCRAHNAWTAERDYGRAVIHAQARRARDLTHENSR